jgi:hypothetical protein
MAAERADHVMAARGAKPHTIYKNSSGKRVPGVTTITGVMDKPALKRWANKLGLQGIEVDKYVDQLATVGTLGHYMIECDIQSMLSGQKVEPDLGDYTPNQVALAETVYIKWMMWKDAHDFRPIWSEKALVSDAHDFGGTLDVFAQVDGKFVLLDIKTCKGIFDEHFTQVGGGYLLLLEEHGNQVDEVRILRLGRSDEEGDEAEYVLVPKLDLHKRRFLVCRELYSLNNQLKRW